MKSKLTQLRYVFLVGINAITSLIIFSASNTPLKAQPSGCGSGSTYYLANYAVLVYPGFTTANFALASRQFRVACDEHDACYDIYGRSQQECDNSFHNRMLEICARDHNTILGRPLRIACNGRADVFYNAVKKFGKTAYDNAQTAARPTQVNYEELTRQLYRQILGREPDPSGFSNNVNAMRQHGFEGVRAGIASSQESRNNINNLYRQYLCRDAEPAGMDHHINLLASGQMTLEQIRNGIANSGEAQQHKDGCR